MTIKPIQVSIEKLEVNALEKIKLDKKGNKVEVKDGKIKLYFGRDVYVITPENALTKKEISEIKKVFQKTIKDKDLAPGLKSKIEVASKDKRAALLKMKGEGKYKHMWIDDQPANDSVDKAAKDAKKAFDDFQNFQRYYELHDKWFK